jgi:hypothetical protein
VAVAATGTRPPSDTHHYNCHPDFRVTYTYDDGVKLVCSSHQLEGAVDPKKGPGNASHDNGVLFVGDDGRWIFVNRDTIQASDPKIIDEPLPQDAVRLYPSNNHMGNFLDCVRSRKRPTCDVEVGHRSATVCHLGVIALRSGKQLRWDPAAEHFVGDPEANKWLSRPMRAPWKLEV